MTKSFHTLQELTGPLSLKMEGNQSKMRPARLAQLQGLSRQNLKPKSKGRVFHFLVNEEAKNTRTYIRNFFGRFASSINQIVELSPK